jgi:hypothetical protein
VAELELWGAAGHRPPGDLATAAETFDRVQAAAALGQLLPAIAGRVEDDWVEVDAGGRPRPVTHSVVPRNR